MMSWAIPILILAALAAAAGFALADLRQSGGGEESAVAPAGSVYQSAQQYWSGIAQARDWDGLKAQLRRWQQLANPGWDESQIEEIARALNAAVFRFAEPRA